MPFGSRVSLVLKADIRPGHTGEIDGKIDRNKFDMRQRDLGIPLVLLLNVNEKFDLIPKTKPIEMLVTICKN